MTMGGAHLAPCPIYTSLLQLLVDQRPDEEPAKHWIGRRHVDTGVQAAPAFSEHEVPALYLQARRWAPPPACLTPSPAARR